MTRSVTNERDLWQIWEGRRLPAILHTREGYELRVLFPGIANTGPGPDFLGALIALDGGEAVRGDVELHVKASSWAGHGHHLDPRYAGVLLHVVLLDDGGPARTATDALVPVLALGPLLDAPAEAALRPPSGPCTHADAPRPAPSELRALVIAAGHERFAMRAATWEGEWTARPAEDCVLRALLRAVGLGRNGEACDALADALDGPTFESLLARAGEHAPIAATAVLLGMAGLLEKAGAEEEVRRTWAAYRDYWPSRPIDPRRWQRFRLRPANLPEARLGMLATVLAQHGLLGFLDHIAALINRQPLPGAAALIAPLMPAGGTTGRAWALEAWTNVLLPLLAGYGHAHEQPRLAARALEIYGTLPGGGENQLLERMVKITGLPATPRPAVEQQGLLQLWQRYCSIQACATCPLATHGDRGDR